MSDNFNISNATGFCNTNHTNRPEEAEIQIRKKLYQGYHPEPDFSKIPSTKEQMKFQKLINGRLIMVGAGWL